MEEHNQPVATLSQNDLNALASILYFYERWLLHSMAPSAKRSKLIAEVQLLLVKVSFLGTARIAMLTFDEVEHITAAIRTFSAHVKKKIPPSKNREDVLASCEGLRSYIVATFAPDKA
ncbi:MAG TPA: hypothetical protein VJ761_14680 [Ktedonobacteraceae bacterium]|nr:hypothetical protein [Ktedonobacteraceae bacterium]